MKLTRLLRGAASARPGPGPRATHPSASRSLASDSGTGPASDRSVPGQVDFYARFSPSPLSMKQFLDFGECCPAAGLCAPPGARNCGPRSPLLSFPDCCPAPSALSSFLEGAGAQGGPVTAHVAFYPVLSKNRPGGTQAEWTPALAHKCAGARSGQAPSDKLGSVESLGVTFGLCRVMVNAIVR